jgi:hypothetical protein
MKEAGDPLSDAEIDALLVGLLCVNHYTLEAGWELRRALRHEGLSDPSTTAKLGIAAVAAGLERAGYKRGRINEIVAPRVVALMKAIDAGELKGLSNAVGSRNERAFGDLLGSVWGFGPRSIANAWLLLTPAQRKGQPRSDV